MASAGQRRFKRKMGFRVLCYLDDERMATCAEATCGGGQATFVALGALVWPRLASAYIERRLACLLPASDPKDPSVGALPHTEEFQRAARAAQRFEEAAARTGWVLDTLRPLWLSPAGACQGCRARNSVSGHWIYVDSPIITYHMQRADQAAHSTYFSSMQVRACGRGKAGPHRRLRAPRAGQAAPRPQAAGALACTWALPAVGRAQLPW